MVELPRGGRTPGVHLSGVISAILKQEPQDLDHAAAVRMAVGLAWEDWYGPRTFGPCYRPGEFVCDGVISTPDVVDPHRRVVAEIKSTSRRPGSPPTGVLRWMLQIQGLLWAVGQGEWTDAEFHVCYLACPQQVRIWALRFDPKQLESVWLMILSYRDKALPEGFEE